MTDLVQFLGSSPAVTQPQPSHVKLVQGSSTKLKGNPGQLYDKDTGAVYDSLDVVIVGKELDRALYDPKETHSDSVLCKSSNGITPDEGVESPQAVDCTSCRHQFEKHIDAKGRITSRPFCKRGHRLGLIAAETKLPHFVTFGGTSEDVAIHGLKRLQEAVRIERKSGNDVYHVDFHFRLRGERVKNYAIFVLEGPWLISDPETFGPYYSEVLARCVGGSQHA